MMHESAAKKHVLRRQQRTWVVDVGGTCIKSSLFRGQKPSAPIHVVSTPPKLTPQKLIRLLNKNAPSSKSYDHVSVGFPGVVKNGEVITAPHFHGRHWTRFNLENKLRQTMKKPVCLINDADLLGFGVIQNKGLELVVTLGTGVGTALYRDGELMPRMEFSHHPIYRGLTYNQFAGNRALKTVGLSAWRKRVRFVLQTLSSLLHYDRVFILGGNARSCQSFRSRKIHLVSQLNGLKGGAMLWRSPNREI